MAAGCGYTGDPLPPLANVPARVNDLSVVQRGNRILARLTVPTMTTEGYRIKGEVMLDLRIGPLPMPYRYEVWEPTATRVPEPPIEKGTATYEIPTAAWTGREAAIAVRVIGANGKASGWSALVGFPVVPPPETPRAVRADATATGVRLSWQAAGMDFRIFRRAGADNFMPVGEAPQSPWTDMSSEFGKMYVYRIQTIAKLPGTGEAESDPSEEVVITPQDAFPPAPPAGLRVTAAPNTIELSWDSNSESDLAGYRIYRSTDGGPFEKLAELSTLPTYSDKAVERGKTYRYAISAFDQLGNESERSAPGEAMLE
jgi:hypothetical protein